MVGAISQFLALVLVAISMQHVVASPAQITVPVVPFFNAESTALAAVVLGVDSQGRTTYAVEQDKEDGGSTRPLTATLVEGTDHVFYTLSHTAPSETVIVGFDCGLKNGKAICSGTNANAQPQTATVSSLGTLVLDIASTGAPSGPTSAASSNPTSVDPSSPSNPPNSSLRISASIPVALSGVLLTAYGLL